MRILIVTGIFPPDTGGPASYVPRIADALTARGHEVTVVALSEAQVNSADVERPYRVVRIRRQQNLARRTVQLLRTLIREGDWADVVFVNGLAFEATLASLVHRRPVVMKVVGDFAWERTRQTRTWSTSSFEAFQTQPQPPRVRAVQNVRSWWTRRATRVLTATAYMGRVVTGWGVDPERVRVISNSIHVPDSDVCADPAIDARMGPRGRRVVMPCRLLPVKQIGWMIEAVTDINGASLLVIGDGPLRAELESHVRRLGVEDRVHLLPGRSQAEAWTAVAACDVLGVVSSSETFSHAAIEGLALGLVVVATPVPGLQEVLASTSRAVFVSTSDAAAPGAVGALRTALEAAFERVRREGRRAEREARFSFAAMVQATEALLVEAASRSTP